MYQRILIPVDGSPTSDRALQEVLALARQQNVQLLLLHVIEEIHFVDIESSINYAELLESMRNSGTKILTQAQTVVQQAGMTAEVKLLEASGKRVASVIVTEAGRWPADLIVIGTHGRSGFSRLLFGSVAEGVVRTAQVPVLLIRGG
ncbi:MAG: universal stress protein [Pseudomonadota bacterium]